MTKKRGLAMGLSELLSDINTINAADTAAIKSALKNLPIDMLCPGKFQPRRDMDHDALQELANSIRQQGIIQPLVVRQIAPGKYEIIAGERRWRAAQLASLQEVPAVIRDIPDETAIAFSLIENIQRENLNVIDTAHAVQRLITEFNMTHEGAADAIGKSRVTVTNLLRLLGLQDDVKAMIQRGELEMGHGRALLALEEMRQAPIAKIIAAKGLSVRSAENLVRQLLKPRSTAATSNDLDILQLQRDISDKLGARVTFHHTKSGKGKMIVRYSSLDELDGLLARIK
jgi:ParB family transcriptional regulator, chromosome partitioning protein